MPAAAVIPAPIAYIKAVAVEKLVVGLLSDKAGLRFAGAFGSTSASLRGGGAALDCAVRFFATFTLR